MMACLYRRRQRGTLVLAVSGGLAVVLAAVLVREGGTLPAALAVLGPLALAVLFGSLTVEVSRDDIRLWFGPGLVRRRVLLRDVAGAAAVRNSWLAGWGIRWLPQGWLYNVSGLDAVELRFARGGIVRIGTDRPHELEAAIRAALSPSPRRS